MTIRAGPSGFGSAYARTLNLKKETQIYRESLKTLKQKKEYLQKQENLETMKSPKNIQNRRFKSL